MKRPRFLKALHGWRGICALLVALSHLTIAGHFYNLDLVRGSWLFVDFFFVLSGFVIARVYDERLGSREGAERFSIARVARLWPVHLATLTIVLLFELVKFGAHQATGFRGEGLAFAGHTSLASLPLNIALVQGFGTLAAPTWNDPSWSVSAEIGAYVLFAFIGLRTPRWKVPSYIAGAVVGLTTLLSFSPSYIGVTADFGLARCLFGFFVGCLLEQLPSPKRHATLLETATTIVSLAFVCVVEGPATLAAPIVFGLTIWVFSADAGALSRLLSRKIPRSLGDLSYSIYMVHFPLLLFAYGALRFFNLMPIDRTALPGGHVHILFVPSNLWIGDALALLYLGIVVAAAAVLRSFVELPGRGFITRWRTERGNKVSILA